MDSAKLYNATAAAVHKHFRSRRRASQHQRPQRPLPRTTGAHTQTSLMTSRMFLNLTMGVIPSQRFIFGY